MSSLLGKMYNVTNSYHKVCNTMLTVVANSIPIGDVILLLECVEGYRSTSQNLQTYTKTQFFSHGVTVV